MEVNHYCQFKTKSNRPCRHHERQEFPVRFSPKLGLYLCAQHEYFIVNNHLNQFFKSQLQSFNYETNINYNTFSREVYDRLINDDDLRHIPYQISSNSCLYKFNINWYETINQMIIIRFNVFNDVPNDIIQLSCCIDDNSQSINFDIKEKKNAFLNTTHTYNVIDNFCHSYIPNQINIISPQSDDQLYRANIAFLMITYYLHNDTTQETEQEQIVPVVELNLPTIVEHNTEQQVLIQSRVPSPQPVEEEIIDNTNYQQLNNIDRHSHSHSQNDNRRWSGIPGIRPRITQHTDIKITTINYCLICGSEDIQKGFQMSCCNEENTICNKCIITNQILDKLKYCSIFDITNLNMFDDKQDCFFCRHSNTYKDIKYDIDCKKTFIDILSDKVKEELLNKQLRYLNSVLENLNM
jgi:hypothetical protein